MARKPETNSALWLPCCGPRYPHRMWITTGTTSTPPVLCGVARRAYKSCGQPPRVDEAVLMQSLPAKSHPHEGAVSAVSEDLASSGRERTRKSNRIRNTARKRIDPSNSAVTDHGRLVVPVTSARRSTSAAAWWAVYSAMAARPSANRETTQCRRPWRRTAPGRAELAPLLAPRPQGSERCRHGNTAPCALRFALRAP